MGPASTTFTTINDTTIRASVTNYYNLSVGGGGGAIPNDIKAIFVNI